MLMDKQHEGSRKTKPTYQAVAIYEIMAVEKIMVGCTSQGRGRGKEGNVPASGDESEGEKASSEEDDEEDEGEEP